MADFRKAAELIANRNKERMESVGEDELSKYMKKTGQTDREYAKRNLDNRKKWKKEEYDKVEKELSKSDNWFDKLKKKIKGE